MHDEAYSNVLVCVTIQHNSLELIKKGAKLARDIDAKLNVLHVEKGSKLNKNKNSSIILNDLFNLTKKVGGQVNIELSKNIPETIVDFIDKNDVTHVVMGESLDGALAKLLKKNIIKTVSSKAEDTNILILKRHVDENKEDALLPLRET